MWRAWQSSYIESRECGLGVVCHTGAHIVAGWAIVSPHARSSSRTAPSSRARRSATSTAARPPALGRTGELSSELTSHCIYGLHQAMGPVPAIRRIAGLQVYSRFRVHKGRVVSARWHSAGLQYPRICLQVTAFYWAWSSCHWQATRGAGHGPQAAAGLPHRDRARRRDPAQAR